MRRRPSEEVTAAARRRLELLGRELAQAGLEPRPDSVDLARLADPVTGELPPGDLAGPRVLQDRGRHARTRGGAGSLRVGGWLTDRLPPTLQGRIGLGSAHVALVAVVVALGLAVAAVVVLRSGGGEEPVPVAAPVSGDAGRSLISAAPATPTASPADAASAGPAATTVVVDIAGKVRRPGVATLPAGSRVIDALRRAGGARPGVSLASLNLARVLVDGEQILVGVEPAPGLAAAAASTPGAPVAGRLVNLNSATAEQLDALPDVGPVTAQKIIDWRTQHGAFSSVDELLEVDGIGDKTLAKLAPYLTL